MLSRCSMAEKYNGTNEDDFRKFEFQATKKNAYSPPRVDYSNFGVKVTLSGRDDRLVEKVPETNEKSAEKMPDVENKDDSNIASTNAKTTTPNPDLAKKEDYEIRRFVNPHLQKFVTRAASKKGNNIDSSLGTRVENPQNGEGETSMPKLKCYGISEEKRKLVPTDIDWSKSSSQVRTSPKKEEKKEKKLQTEMRKTKYLKDVTRLNQFDPEEVKIYFQILGN